jgi:anti-sigma factor RsiW
VTERFPADLPCDRFVELVTEYLEGALTADERSRVDAHVAICAGCQVVLEQWREVVRLTGRLAESDVDEIDPDARAALMTTFRELHGRPAP